MEKRNLYLICIGLVIFIIGSLMRFPLDLVIMCIGGMILFSTIILIGYKTRKSRMLLGNIIMVISSICIFGMLFVTIGVLALRSR